MVENIETAPEAGDDSTEPVLSARDISPGDREDFNTADKLSKADNEDSLAAFDSENGFKLTGFEESGLAYVDESREQPNEKSVERGKDEAPLELNLDEVVKSLEAASKLGERGAEIEKNPDGTLKSLQIRDLGSSSTFEFSDSGIKRIANSADKRTVTEFDHSGSPVSATESSAGNLDGKPVPVSPEDNIHIILDGDNIVLQSSDKESDTTIRFNQDGKVLDRSISSADAEIWTEYNEDGSMKLNTLTKFDENGKILHRTAENEIGTVDDYFDKDGNWEKTVTNGTGFVRTFSVDEDGSQRTLLERDDGTATLSLMKEDGTRSVGEVKPGVNSLLTINKNGSSVSIVDTDKYSTNTATSQNGYWIQNRRDKDTGVSKITHGDANGPYKGEVTNYDA